MEEPSRLPWWHRRVLVVGDDEGWAGIARQPLTLVCVHAAIEAKGQVLCAIRILPVRIDHG